MPILFSKVSDRYGCFSNFSRHHIVVDGKRWRTVEHYFQAMKFPHEPDRQKRIQQASTPKEAKRIAWKKPARVPKEWDRMRLQIMLTALRAKFEQHAELRETLLSTESETLVEHTSRDSYWGDGGRPGRGANKLGILLMQVRDELRRDD